MKYLVLAILLCGCTIVRVMPPQSPSGMRQVPQPGMTAVPVLVSGNPALTLGWTLSTATNVASQTLSYGVASGTYTNNTVLPPQANQFQVTNLVWATTYFFAVKCTAVGGLSSPYSVELMYTTTNLPPQAPPAPTNLKIISVP